MFSRHSHKLALLNSKFSAESLVYFMDIVLTHFLSLFCFFRLLRRL